jgi:hypothetical protein
MMLAAELNVNRVRKRLGQAKDLGGKNDLSEEASSEEALGTKKSRAQESPA